MMGYWICGFALQANNGAKHVEEWKEVRNHTHADQKVVSAFHGRTCLSQKNESSRQHSLHGHRNVGRLPFRMNSAKRWRQEFVHAGHEGQPRSSSEVRADRADAAQRHKHRSERRDRLQADSACDFADGLHESL